MKQHGSTVWRATVRPLFSVSRSNVGSQHVIGFISTVYFRFISDFLLFLSKYLVLIPIVFHNKCSTPNRLFWLNINSVFSSWSYVAYHMSHMVYSESSYLVIRLADRLWIITYDTNDYWYYWRWSGQLIPELILNDLNQPSLTFRLNRQL